MRFRLNGTRLVRERNDGSPQSLEWEDAGCREPDWSLPHLGVCCPVAGHSRIYPARAIEGPARPIPEPARGFARGVLYAPADGAGLPDGRCTRRGARTPGRLLARFRGLVLPAAGCSSDHSQDRDRSALHHLGWLWAAIEDPACLPAVFLSDRREFDRRF